MNGYDYPDADAIPSGKPAKPVTDHAQRFRGCTDHQCIYLEGKPRQGMGTNGGCRCDPRPLLRDMQQRIAQAHAAGRREGMKYIEEMICERTLCGHFTPEEIRQETQRLLAQLEAQGKEG